jgi:hypothetical protein
MNLIASFECKLKGRPADLIAVSVGRKGGKGKKGKIERR